MKILFLEPRLDCSFKQGHVPKEEGPPNNPVRVYWKMFSDQVKKFCARQEHELIVDKRALWQFDPKEVERSDCDVVLVPHHSFRTFSAGPKVRYYMQMGIPWLFSIDSKGWCADASFWPLPIVEYGFPASNWFRAISTELKRKNVSKFEQPNVTAILPKDFILFCCQLPHDTTIMYHSDTSVAEGLKQTMDFAHSINLPVVAKGHPVNPASMQELKIVFEQNKRSGDMWVDNASIHQCLEECEAMFSVNSGGAGLDAIINEKPIFVFGRADYQSIAHVVDKDIKQKWETRKIYVEKYPQFLYNYMHNHYNVADETSFEKLETILK